MRVAFVPLGFLGGALLCRLWLQHPPQAVNTDLSQPLAVVTYWQGYGALMFLAFAVAIGIAIAGYADALRGKISPAAATIACVLACGAALAFPVVFSSDVYAYAGYGDLALHGIDPYAHLRIALRDPLLDAVQWQWGNPPPMCVYGPAFVWLAREIVALTLPSGAAAPLWALRAIACAALVLCVPLAYAAFAPFGDRARRIAAAGIALNPIAIWACAEGHNDALLLAIVLAGFALVQRNRVFAGALAVALSALVKAPGLIAAALYAAASWHDRERRMRVLGGALLGAAVVAGLALPLEYGVQTHMAGAGHYFPQYSLQALAALILPVPLAYAVVIAPCALAALCGIRMLAAGNMRGALWFALAAWCAVPNPYPWYALWILPVAFLVWETPEARAIVAASLLAALRYYAEATTALSAGSTAVLVLAQFGIPIALVIAGYTYRARRGRPESRTRDLGFARLRSR